MAIERGTERQFIQLVVEGTTLPLLSYTRSRWEVTADVGATNVSNIKLRNENGIAFYIEVKSILALSDNDMELLVGRFKDGG